MQKDGLNANLVKEPQNLLDLQIIGTLTSTSQVQIISIVAIGY